MLMYYSKKRIAKWKFWHNKGKWPFCITVGLSTGLFICSLFLILFLVSGHSLSVGRMIGATLAIALGGTVIGWMAWYENEEKYEHWLHEQQKNKNKRP